MRWGWNGCWPRIGSRRGGFRAGSARGLQDGSRGETETLLKGHLRTDELLRVLLDRENGLRTGRLLSDVLLYEDVLSGETRLAAITDGGLNVLPTLTRSGRSY